MSISKTKEQIVALSESGKVMFDPQGSLLVVDDLIALADSHTKLLEAADNVMGYLQNILEDRTGDTPRYCTQYAADSLKAAIVVDAGWICGMALFGVPKDDR